MAVTLVTVYPLLLIVVRCTQTPSIAIKSNKDKLIIQLLAFYRRRRKNNGTQLRLKIKQGTITK